MVSLFRFRRGLGPVDLALGMAGIRMGERFLQVGAGDPAVFAAASGKVGLTGGACAVVDSTRAASALDQAAVREGVLVDVAVAAAGAWPYGDASFDVALVDGNLIGALDAGARAAILADVRRVVRGGGRVLVVHHGKPGLLGRLGFGAADVPNEVARQLEAAMAAGGFAPVRFLAAREGLTFVEGFRPR